MDKNSNNHNSLAGGLSLTEGRKQRNAGTWRFMSETKIDENALGSSKEGNFETSGKDSVSTSGQSQVQQFAQQMRSPQAISSNPIQLLQQTPSSNQNHHALFLQLQQQQTMRNHAPGSFSNTNDKRLAFKSDRMFTSTGHQMITRGSTQKSTDEMDELHENSQLVSYHRFKNTSGVGLATQSVRRSLNEMTQQMKKSKEIHELIAERKNIENMIVSSKLWSPPFQGAQGLNTSSGALTVKNNGAEDFTSNVFKDKKDELAKILKKRLSYIHQQSQQNQHLLGTMVSGGASLKHGGSALISAGLVTGGFGTPQRGSQLKALNTSPGGSFLLNTQSVGRTTYRSNQRNSANANNMFSPKVISGAYTKTANGSMMLMQNSSNFTSAEKPSPSVLPISYADKAIFQQAEAILTSKAMPSQDQSAITNRGRQAVPGKGGNPFMIKNQSPPAFANKQTKEKNNNTASEAIPIPQLINDEKLDNIRGAAADPLINQVDALINDANFKRGMQEQLQAQSISNMNKTGGLSKQQFNHQASSIDTLGQTAEQNELQGGQSTHGGNTSLQRQMIYQTDFQYKVGQINKCMDEEFDTLDQAMEHLKLKKPHQLGQPSITVMPSHSHSPMLGQGGATGSYNPFRNQGTIGSKTKRHRNMMGQTTDTSFKHHEIASKSPDSPRKSMHNADPMMMDMEGMDEDGYMGLDMQEQLQMEHIRNFALQLMRERHAMDSRDSKAESFNTDMGMAFSSKQEFDDNYGVHRHRHHNHGGLHDEINEEEDEDGSPTSQTKKTQVAKQVAAEVLETERDLKFQEKDFLNKVQGLLIQEFNMVGAPAQTPRESEESLYWKRRKTKKAKKSALDEMPPFVEEYMKNLKTQTLEALTSDVRARNSFFQFIRHHHNAVFGEKFTSDPKLNYLLQCNKEFVTALPTMSKIQGKALNLLGYRLSEGVCKAIRTYLENFKNAITKIALENNGLARGEELAELLQGVKAQEDFKQIVVIQNTVDDAATSIMVEMLARSFPRALEELRIINCKISPVNTQRILSTINDGSSSLRKLALASAQISEQSLGLLASIVSHVRSLQELDISWNGLRPNWNMKKFLEAIGHNRSLQYLNLSWNNLMVQLPTVKEPQQKDGQPDNSGEGANQPTQDSKKQEPGKLDEYSQALLDNLLRFIKYNRHLIHLDLSYCRLDEFMIIQLGTALRRAKSLVAVHFTGNPGVTQNATEFLHQRVHCRPHLDRQTRKESQQVMQSLCQSSPRQNKAFEGVQLKQILQKQKIARVMTGGHAFKGADLEAEGQCLQFQRWLGHAFEIPKSGQWQMNSAWQDVRDPCWVCNRLCYTIIYWSPSIQFSVSRTVRSHSQLQHDFTGCDMEAELVRPLLRPGPKNPKANPNAPTIAGSFTNWEVRDMIPLISLCEYLDPNKQDPIAILKKQGRIREDIETEADLKTDKERAHFERVKDQIKQEYKQKWKQTLLKAMRYKRACHVNLEFASEIDLRKEDIYLFAVFGAPGQHLYYVKDPASHREHVNKCIIPLREEEIPIYEKMNKTKVQQRVFKKDASVFKDWKEDTPATLQTMFLDDIKWWKASRFVKDDTDRERVERLLQRNFQKIKKIFTVFICQSSFPNISWIDFGNFCEKCKIIDGKGVTLATVDRAFIAANVAVDGQKLSEDNPTNALSRFEFLEIILRLAQSKYKETGICATYEEALSKLLEEHIFPYANPDPWQEFRDELLWTIDVNDVLEVNLEGLKKVYTNYHEPRKKFMTMADALSLMMKDTTLGLIEKDAIYCYGMCKMSVILEQDNMWQYKQLKFVELLELVGRIAHQKFKDLPELAESLTLAQKIEHVLDVIFKMVDVQRKEVHNNVVEESESDDDY